MPTLGIANNLRSVWLWKLALASGRMVVPRWCARDDLSTTQNLQGMTRLHAIGDTLKRQERLLDVVFVHGAGGHYLNSWGFDAALVAHGGELVGYRCVVTGA